MNKLPTIALLAFASLVQIGTVSAGPSVLVNTKPVLLDFDVQVVKTGTDGKKTTPIDMHGGAFSGQKIVLENTMEVPFISKVNAPDGPESKTTQMFIATSKGGVVIELLPTLSKMNKQGLIDLEVKFTDTNVEMVTTETPPGQAPASKAVNFNGHIFVQPGSPLTLNLPEGSSDGDGSEQYEMTINIKKAP